MKKKGKGILSRASDYIANFKSRNVQAGTDVTIESMDLLNWKAGRIEKVGFEQAKGNLFEYIESAKLQRNLGNSTGTRYDKIPVTDVGKHMGGVGENTAPDDFRFYSAGKIAGRGQAKFNNDPHKAALNFANPKYTGMQRLAPSDMMTQIKSQLDQMVDRGEISKAAYDDAIRNLKFDGLTDPITGVSSGGTTSKEIFSLCGENGKIDTQAVKNYAKKFEMQQFGKEITMTAKNGAVSSAVMGGIVSGVTNFCQVISDEKELEEAIKDIEKETLKSGVRGGAVGALGSSIRIAGVKNGIPVLNDSTAAITIAGGVIDSGAAIYAYTKGEITGEELRNEIVDTTVKSTSTIFIMKGLGIALKSVSPIAPIVVYSVASQMVSATRTIIENAKLNAEEYNRAAELLKESVRLMQEYHRQMNQYLSECEAEQREAFSGLIDGFTFNPVTGEGYEQTISTIVNFANKTGMELQHTDFGDYCRAMKSKDAFVLK